MPNDPMTLETDDPVEALRQIAIYLRTVDMSNARAVRANPDSENVSGFWQCTEWLEGLNEIANECDRIRANNS